MTDTNKRGREMKRLTVVNGAVELHGERLLVREESGLFLAVDCITTKSGPVNEVWQYLSVPRLYHTSTGLVWAPDDRSRHASRYIKELKGMTITQCRNELYKLNFEGGQ